MYKKKKTAIVRITTQILGSLGVNPYFEGIFNKSAIYQGSMKSFCVPVLNCYACPLASHSCPIGSLQVLLSGKTIPFYVIGTLMAFGLLAARWFCGWVCPFGLVQDFLAKLNKREHRSPMWISFGKYVVLAVIVLAIPLTFPYIFSENANYSYFCKICPWGGLGAGIPLYLWNPAPDGMQTINTDSLYNLFYLKISIVAAFVFVSLFYDRIFCQAMCPLGAILGLFNKISLVQLSVNDTCTQCKLCVNNCPFSIPVYLAPNHPDCIRCLKCTHQCDAIEISIAGMIVKGGAQKRKAKIT